jgi:hypothetical protein
MVRHIALFQFKDGITQAGIDDCFEALIGMQDRIPGIVGFEYGPRQCDEGLNDGFTHGFIMSFDTAANRDAYLPHPEHERVRDIVVPCLERVVVFDFEV